MLDDMAWRKTPRDLLTNPKIRTIANRIKPELKQAVFAFYAACYMQADDNGILDISDTEVFADLLLLDDENDVTELARQFIKRGFMEALNEEQTLLLMTDWDTPGTGTTCKNGHKIPETQEDRRKRINKIIDDDGKSSRKQPDCDKKEQSVTVPEKRREKNRTEREEKNTHNTQEQNLQPVSHESAEGAAAGEDGAQSDSVCVNDPQNENYDVSLQDVYDNIAAQEKVITAEPEAQNDSTMHKNGTAAWTTEDTVQVSKEMGIPDSVARKMIAVGRYEDWKAAGVLYSYFRKANTLSFDKDDVQIDALMLLTVKCSELSEPKNPPHIIAGQLCTLFNELITNTGAYKGPQYIYYKDMIALPDRMLKPGVFPRLIGEVKKRLKPGKTASNVWIESMQRYAKEVEKDKENYNGNSIFETECKAMGIDTGKPGAYAAYCAQLAAGRSTTTG